ncbi:MAG TPA: GGDEF domain-containing protein, partial [Treponemataceae bacterium]|nr:GGDEF domain-containing protein [Treponemataceae bacterium]
FQALLQDNPAELAIAKKFLFEPNDNIQYFTPFYFLVAGDLFKRKENMQKAQQKWQTGLAHAKERENKWYISCFAARLDSELPEPIPIRLKEIDTNWGWILSSAKMQTQLVTLHQRFDDIQFLNTFQIMSSGIISKKELLSESMNLFYSSFITTTLYFISWTNEKWTIKETRGKAKGINSESLALLLPLLKQKHGQRYFKNLPKQVTKENKGLSYFTAFSVFFVSGEHAVNQILFIFDKREQKMRAETMQVLSIAIRQLGLALKRLEQNDIIHNQNKELSRQNVLLEKTATTDQLTGIGNRNLLEASIKIELSRMRRNKRSEEMFLSILFIDLDNFKFFNDTYGHAMGDIILQKTAELLENSTRDNDLIFRYGGDEFVIVLPETPLAEAKALADRIITNLLDTNSFASVLRSSKKSHRSLQKNTQLSCSIGISGSFANDTKNATIKSLLFRSDKALYEAKQEGKSRSFVFKG